MKEVVKDGIGASAKRKEIGRFVTGSGTFVDDVQPPGCLYVAFVRSSHAHARIRGVDASQALSLPGVQTVLSGEELAKRLDKVAGGPKRNVKVYPLAVGKVRYVGEPIAAVAADTRYHAEDGAGAVVVDYDPLPAVVDSEKAMEPSSTKLFDELESNVVFEFHFATPELEGIFAKADRVFTVRLSSHRFSPCPIEPRAYCAQFEPQSGVLTFWATTAGAHAVRTRMAEMLGFPESKIRVIAPDVGGSFGVKNGGYQEEAVMCCMALTLGKPVKWAETRVEHLRAARQGRDQVHYVQAAVKRDGTILALKDKIIADMGCAYGIDASITAAALYVPGVYKIQNYGVDAYGIATNKAVHGSLRGIGKADAAFVVERMVDVIAKGLGMDSIDLRRKNYIPPEAFPYRSVTGALYDSGRYDLCLTTVLELANYQEAKKERDRLKTEGIHRGIGVALVMEPTSSSRLHRTGGYAACRLRIEPSGTVSVFSSTGDQGQAHGTILGQIVSSKIGFPAEKIHEVRGDTWATPYGFGTGSSRSSVVQMNAALVAAEKLRLRLLRIASRIIKVPMKRLCIKDGKISDQDDPKTSIPLQEIVRIAYGAIHLLPEDEEPGLEVTGYFVNPNIDYEPDEMGRMNTFSSYPYAGVVAIVDVDIETGFIHIVKYFTVHDCGNLINPKIVETQHYGSVVQGIGGALYEELRFDEDGQPLNSTFMDYRLPPVMEVPEIVLDHLVTPNPFTPLGTKGAGETGMLGPPPALASAIEDALSDFGVEIRNTPFTPEMILALIREGKKNVMEARSR